MSDDELDEAKADPKQWFDLVYGGEWGARNLGNTHEGDGYKYRGRGFNQLTGLSNYARYGQKIGVDLVANPDLANDPAVAAKIAVAYIQDRYKGGGFEAMMRCVGTTVGDVAERKRAYYQQYCQSGEFACGAPLSNEYDLAQHAVVHDVETDDSLVARVQHWLQSVL